jgi:hypothetical protein
MRGKYLVLERRTVLNIVIFFYAGPEEAGHSDKVRGQETDHQAGESQQSGTVSSYQRYREIAPLFSRVADPHSFDTDPDPAF